MPELPEVETIRRDLARRLRGLTISGVDVRLGKIVSPPGRRFADALRAARVERVKRRAKLIRLDLVDRRRRPLVLLVHLKMTGQLVFRHRGELVAGGHPIAGVTLVPNRYTHVVFRFTNGDVLYFNDLRQFGYLKLLTPAAAERYLQPYGLEPLSGAFTPERFAALLASRQRATLKAVLMDQRLIAGLGNIYADEVCWRARLRPHRRVGSLTARELRLLWRAIRAVLVLSIKHRGTSFNTYVGSDGRKGDFWKYRQVYGRGGQPCQRCGIILSRTVIAGRGTVYCSGCQR